MLMEAPRGYPLHQGGQGEGKKARGGEKKWRFKCLSRIRQREAQLPMQSVVLYKEYTEYSLTPTRHRPTSVLVGTVASTRQSHGDHENSSTDTTVAVFPLQFFAKKQKAIFSKISKKIHLQFAGVSSEWCKVRELRQNSC